MRQRLSQVNLPLQPLQPLQINQIMFNFFTGHRGYNLLFVSMANSNPSTKRPLARGELRNA